VNLKGAEVVSVDTAEKKFKVKHRKNKLEVRTNADTAIKKGKEPSEFVTVVLVGAKLELEVVNGVAVTVTAKK
jgi:hypothetical protein